MTEKEFLQIRCPVCDSPTDVRASEDTVLINFPLHCPHCNAETIIHVVKLKMVPTPVPDARAADL